MFYDDNDDDEGKWPKGTQLLGFTEKYTDYDDFVYVCDRCSEGAYK